MMPLEDLTVKAKWHLPKRLTESRPRQAKLASTRNPAVPPLTK
jgi:hypothetical protein